MFNYYIDFCPELQVESRKKAPKVPLSGEAFGEEQNN